MKMILLFPILIGVFIICSTKIHAQVAINQDGTLPDSSSILDLKSTNKGFLPPRMSHAQLKAIHNPTPGLIVFCNDCGAGVEGALAIFINGRWLLLNTSCLNPLPPNEGTHIADETQITWHWNPVPDATGYKWNQTDDYITAIDLGMLATYTETGLTCDSVFSRFVWAYNDCGNSTPSTLTQETSLCFNCGYSFTVEHIEGDVAPVTKTVYYSTVANIPGEETKCWITSNLGADHQATVVNDASESSAGWYWQFNKKQGYKHDGMIRTPNTSWISNINENSDWIPSNDPCNLELVNWRIPTYIEWYNIRISGGWMNANGPWNTALKIHLAGRLYDTYGQLDNRGYYGYYWSSTQGDVPLRDIAWDMNFHPDYCGNYLENKARAHSIRCLRDTSVSVPDPPTAGVHTASLSEITWEWNTVDNATGYKWNSVNDYPSATDMGNNTTSISSGLLCGTNYSSYVWAYNYYGHSNSATLQQSTNACCGNGPLTVNHSTAGGVAPIDKTVIYSTTSGIPGEETKCWITSNLGADHQATSVNDATEASAGWYWQFNRKQGFKHDGLVRTPNSTWISYIEEAYDWLQENDPCQLELGSGWRIPLNTEWNNIDATGGWSTWNGPWNSALKLHAAGYLENAFGVLSNRGSYGVYWSRIQNNTYQSWYFSFSSGNCGVWGNGDKSVGHTLRCIKEL